MFLYLDSSALVKRYIDEPHSEAVAHLMDDTLAIGTSAISRVEVGAALARAARGNRLDAEGARGAQEQFAEDWPDFGRTARSRPRMRGDAHGPRRERPVRMLRRRPDSRGERRRAQDLAGLTELPRETPETRGRRDELARPAPGQRTPKLTYAPLSHLWSAIRSG